MPGTCCPGNSAAPLPWVHQGHWAETGDRSDSRESWPGRGTGGGVQYWGSWGAFASETEWGTGGELEDEAAQESSRAPIPHPDQVTSLTCPHPYSPAGPPCPHSFVPAFPLAPIFLLLRSFLFAAPPTSPLRTSILPPPSPPQLWLSQWGTRSSPASAVKPRLQQGASGVPVGTHRGRAASRSTGGSDRWRLGPDCTVAGPEVLGI